VKIQKQFVQPEAFQIGDELPYHVLPWNPRRNSASLALNFLYDQGFSHILLEIFRPNQLTLW
jgi:hypothetical protein